MARLEVLKEKIEKSGFRIAYLAELCSLSKQAFYNKLNGKFDFTAEEVGILKRALNLTYEEVDYIFLRVS